MDLSQSSLNVDVVLQRIEDVVFLTITQKVWSCYINDNFVIVKTFDIEHLKELINLVDASIQFTMGTEINNQLSFINVLVSGCTNGHLRTVVLRKSHQQKANATFRNMHSLSHKLSCVRLRGTLLTLLAAFFTGRLQTAASIPRSHDLLQLTVVSPKAPF
uniref:Uncharacterized protein n=1 Tax=Schistocephalus solidus TaxID=70667 RepID=A0A0X3PD31_SCHSO